MCFEKYSTININGKGYGGSTSIAKTSNILIVEVKNELRPAKIHYFATVSALINSLPKNHVLVYLSCYKHHLEKEICGNPFTVWESDFFEPSQFVQVESKTVCLVEKLNDAYRNVLFVSTYD